MEFSSSALNLHPNNESLVLKAHLRRGLANEALKRNHAAKNDIEKII